MDGVTEQRIRERIRGFDIPALLAVLSASGYGDAQVEYRGHRTTLHQSHLVHDIQFIHQPHKRVIITVNMGLLSAQSPLPSFLMQTMDQLDHDRLERFIGFFDHRLLHECFQGLYPERDEALLPGWADTVRDRLRMLRPTSSSTLHWLFAKTFPEVELSVRREVRQQRVSAREMRLGATALGEGDAMGGFASIPTGGMEVKLYCDGPIAGNGVAWAVEARRRFETKLLPLLSESVFMLTVFLVLRDQEGALRLERDSYLGYEPLQDASSYTQQVLLFSGDTSSPPTRGAAVWNKRP